MFILILTVLHVHIYYITDWEEVDCGLGHVLKVIIKSDTFLNKVCCLSVNRFCFINLFWIFYLTVVASMFLHNLMLYFFYQLINTLLSNGSTELNVVCCRLLYGIMIGLEPKGVFQENVSIFIARNPSKQNIRHHADKSFKLSNQNCM